MHELVNFRGESKDPNASGSNVSQANDFGYGGSSNSLLWTIRGNVNYTVENNTNWTAYDDVRIRLYSSVDQTLNAVFYGTVSGKYTNLKVDVKGGEWQEVVVPISELTTGLNASEDQRSIAQVSLAGPGWSNKDYVRDSQVYIDSIYLTKEEFKILSTQPETGTSGVDASFNIQ